MYDNTDSVCGINYNNNSYFFLKNLQGDVIGIADVNGQTVASYVYDAWGKVLSVTDTSGVNIANINPYRYRGYYYDIETQLYYLQSRYYDPNTGRFINADSPEYVAITGGNLFTYCSNCPTKNADYLGFCDEPTYPEFSLTQSGSKKNDGILKDILENSLKALGMFGLTLGSFVGGILYDIYDFFKKHPAWLEVLQWIVFIVGIIISSWWVIAISFLLNFFNLIMTATSSNSTIFDWVGTILGFFTGKYASVWSMILPYLDDMLIVS